MKKIVLLVGFIVSFLVSPHVMGQIQLWNGANGGAGTWNHNNTNWEASTGGTGVWSGGIAQFPKTGGTIEVESSKENPLFFMTLNFLADGYTLNGGYLSINNPDDNNNGYVIISKNNSVEIKSTIMNGGAINALIKQGDGRLILSGDNLHTGGTHVAGGELVVSKDENLGDPVSPVVLEGGNLTVSGDQFTLTDRIFHIAGEKCTLSISNAANSLELTTLLDIKSHFYKDGPGTFSAPINSVWSGNITILNGKLLLKNTEWEWTEILPVNIKGGTFSLSPDKGKGIKLENISGNGILEKDGEGILLLEGSHTARGNFVNKEGIVQLNSDWQGNYEQMSGARLILSPDKSISGKALLRDTIVQNGKNTWLDDVEWNKAVFKLSLNSEIVIRGDLNLTDMNTIVLEKDPELPISLMKVSGNQPTDAETTSSLQVKVGKKLISNNPDYIFTWYENELFLRDKNKPFPLEYKVSLKPSEEIEVFGLKPGDYTFVHGESVSFDFQPKDGSYPADAVLFMVNGEETPFRNLGEGYLYRYTINPIVKDYDIHISIKSFTVKAPEVKGATITSSTGKWMLKYGEPITFTITLDKDYDKSAIKVYANKDVLIPVQQEGGVYTYTLNSVTAPVDLRVLNVNPNDPVSNIETGKNYPAVSSADNLLIIETQTPQTVTVYSLTGRVCAEVTTQNNRVEIPLSKGIYIARIGSDAHKVVVR